MNLEFRRISVPVLFTGLVLFVVLLPSHSLQAQTISPSYMLVKNVAAAPSTTPGSLVV